MGISFGVFFGTFEGVFRDGSDSVSLTVYLYFVRYGYSSHILFRRCLIGQCFLFGI